MEPLDYDVSGGDEYGPVCLGMKWADSNKKCLVRIDLPWDANANSFAEAFQALMAAYGFAPATIKEYVTSELLDNIDDVTVQDKE